MLHPISDRRIERDRASIRGRTAIPFGQEFRSTVQLLGHRQSGTEGYGAYPASLLGDVLSYADPIATPIAFPNGVTRSRALHNGLQFVPVGCTSAVELVGLGTVTPLPSLGRNGDRVRFLGPVGVVGNFVLAVQQPNVTAVLLTGEEPLEPWIIQGVRGYEVVEVDSPRALTVGEIALPGLDRAIVKPIDRPTLPEVLLRLWIGLGYSLSGADGLDLISIKNAALWCRSKGFSYNGDVDPDYLEAWLVQAARSHGLTVTRSRIGLGFEGMGKPDESKCLTLITSLNALNIVKSWECNTDTKTQMTEQLCEEYLQVGIHLLGADRIEEVIGINNDAHLLSVQTLWTEELNLNTKVQGTYSGNRSIGYELKIGSVVAIASQGSRNGYITALENGYIVPSFRTTSLVGFADESAPTNITDRAFDYTGIVSIGDLLVAKSSDGEILQLPITAVTPITLTFDASPKASTIVSYAVHKQIYPVGVQLLTQAPTGLRADVLVSRYSVIHDRLTYQALNLLSTIGSPLAIDKPRFYKVTSVQGPEFKSVG